MTILSFPSVASLFKLAFFDPEPIDFFTDVIRRTMAARRKSGTRRNDLIDLSLDALRANAAGERLQDDGGEEGQFERDARVKAKGRVSQEELEALLVANLIQLFMAGFETTSTILAVTLHHLAMDQEVQERLREEVSAAVEANDGSPALDYHTAQGLPYLDAVVSEAARHYPLTVVERQCVRDYPVPGTGFTVPSGMIVALPTHAVHLDPEHWGPDPERFDPDHFFDRERKAARSPYAYLAFGQGPRNCVGMRFAILQMKLALVALVNKFKLVPSAKTMPKLEVDPKSRAGHPIGGFWVKIQKRE